MAPQKKDATGLIAGPLKVIARTERKDRDKRVMFEAECVCGTIEYGAVAVLGRYLGHGLTCPGHPLKKSNEKPDGTAFFPDQQPEYDVALAAWEAAHHPGKVKEEIPVEHADAASSTTETPIVAETVSTTKGTAAVTPIIAVATPAVSQKPLNAAVNKDTSTKMSAVLATRLKLTNYHTTSKKLTPPVKILGQDATSVVFAEDATGTDLVMLHICLSSTDGKTKSIVSSMKKVPAADFSVLTSTLAEMKVTWRSKDQPLIAVAK